jgi:hypothetical protein
VLHLVLVKLSQQFGGCLVALAIFLDFFNPLTSYFQVSHFHHLIMFDILLATSLIHLFLLCIPLPSPGLLTLLFFPSSSPTYP